MLLLQEPLVAIELSRGVKDKLVLPMLPHGEVDKPVATELLRGVTDKPVVSKVPHGAVERLSVHLPLHSVMVP